jgi:hypothetical protein
MVIWSQPCTLNLSCPPFLIMFPMVSNPAQNQALFFARCSLSTPYARRETRGVGDCCDVETSHCGGQWLAERAPNNAASSFQRSFIIIYRSISPMP